MRPLMMTLLLALATTAVAEERPAAAGDGIQDHAVVYYYEQAVDAAGVVREVAKAVVLNEVEVVHLGSFEFLRGEITDRVGQRLEGGMVHLRLDRVFMIASTDANTATRELTLIRENGLWRTVEEPLRD